MPDRIRARYATAISNCSIRFASLTAATCCSKSQRNRPTKNRAAPGCWTSWKNCTANIHRNAGKTARRISFDTRNTICTATPSIRTTDGGVVRRLGLLDRADRQQGSTALVRAASARLNDFDIVTTQMALVETLASQAGSGDRARLAATRLVERLAESPQVEIIPKIDAQFKPLSKATPLARTNAGA